jgi:hypothetical protein
MISSATRCSKSKQMHYASLPILLGWWINEGDEWKMFGLDHKDVSLMKMSKRASSNWPTHIYKAPKLQLAVAALTEAFMGASDTTLFTSDKSP